MCARVCVRVCVCVCVSARTCAFVYAVYLAYTLSMISVTLWLFAIGAFLIDTTTIDAFFVFCLQTLRTNTVALSIANTNTTTTTITTKDKNGTNEHEHEDRNVVDNVAGVGTRHCCGEDAPTNEPGE